MMKLIVFRMFFVSLAIFFFFSFSTSRVVYAGVTTFQGLNDYRVVITLNLDYRWCERRKSGLCSVPIHVNLDFDFYIFQDKIYHYTNYYLPGGGGRGIVLPITGGKGFYKDPSGFKHYLSIAPKKSSILISKLVTQKANFFRLQNLFQLTFKGKQCFVKQKKINIRLTKGPKRTRKKIYNIEVKCSLNKGRINLKY